MRLRAYRRSDLAAMVALDEICFSEAFLFGTAAMRRFAEAKNAFALVAEQSDAALAGFVIAHRTARGPLSKGYCITLDVAPEHRRSGLGRTLLAAAETWAHEAGAAGMALHVHTGNAGAIRFYESCGYLLQRVVPGFYGNPGMDALEYSKQL